MKNLSGKDRWSKVYLNDDYTQLQRSQNSDLSAIASLAKSKGFEAKVRASNLWVEGRRYSYHIIARMPHNDINIEKAKTIEVDNGKGIGFQSRHSKFSNLAPCVVKLDDLGFASSEAAFQYLRARNCATKKQIEEILLVAQGEAKLRSYGINETEEWKQKKSDEMLHILVLKFTQNEDLKKALLDTGDKQLYKFTRDKYWGVGLTLSQAHLLKDGKGPGQNNLGKLLMLVRQKLMDSA